MTKLSTKLLQRAARLSSEYQKVQGLLTDAFNARYGCTYSDVDADGLIDVLDYGGGHITLAEADNIMTAAGHPPIRKALATGDTP